ncbi:MAG: SDR family oxidoreductase [Rhodospirillaceae bacterium]|jgi:NAD(P)-dependent dehydrogenase (short-subunit alcohol dehydrogenase family)|nr:SDR family oxidoreductase [Rhodospirillaceae bacterium]MBT5245529.1 SDR family oxidoreductase [Rhodospirillaceae bacterium]MBT5561011.1 SDR family oxidoreductase [Rhodospirillaceae bacterium]MBT6240647.1 SDR family oxidoreductase [Rhodospirillaceae bacterium]
MSSKTTIRDAFDLSGQVAVITGGGGLLGTKHGEAVLECGGTAVLIDLDEGRAQSAAEDLNAEYNSHCLGLGVDITQADQVDAACQSLLEKFGRIDILINNAANNPKMENQNGDDFSRLESFPRDIWDADLAVGLTGAFLCSRTFGAVMAGAGKGVILNVASDLALIAPDQRLYQRDGVAGDKQPVKPVTYSVVKSGLIGLTRYLATYWADKGVRANAIAPGGVYTDQDDAFVERLARLIPMGRMASVDEYKAAVAFMISDASSYMTGSVLPIDGGRTCW